MVFRSIRSSDIPHLRKRSVVELPKASYTFPPTGNPLSTTQRPSDKSLVCSSTVGLRLDTARDLSTFLACSS